MCFCFELCDSVSRSFISGWRFVIVFWALLFFATVSSFLIFWLWSFVILFQEFLTLFSLLCCSVLSLQPGHRYVVLQTLLLKTLMLIPSLQVITLPPLTTRVCNTWTSSLGDRIRCFSRCSISKFLIKSLEIQTNTSLIKKKTKDSFEQ